MAVETFNHVNNKRIFRDIVSLSFHLGPTDDFTEMHSSEVPRRLCLEGSAPL